MAILKNSILGDVKGKLSNVVIRKVKGKDIISVRPAKYKKTKSTKAKYVRSRFSVAVEFSKYINSISILKDVWSNAEIKLSSTFNMIEKYNINNVNDNAPSLQNIITPPMDINHNICSLPLDDFRYDNGKVIAKLSTKDAALRQTENDDYTLVFVLLLFEPKSENDNYFMLDNVVCPDLSNNSAEDEIILPVKRVVSQKISSYNKLIIYAASVKPGAGKIKYYSSYTCSRQFDLAAEIG